MSQLLSKLQIIRHFLALASDTSQTERVFKLVDELNRLPELQAKFPPVEAVAAFLRDPYCQGFPSLAALRVMPEGSLGRALALHMDELGVDFSAFDRKAEPEDTLAWVDRHAYETHDIWHALTGWGPGTANEIGLQAFYLAQLQSVPSLTLTILGLARVFGTGQGDVGPILEVITHGWRQGRAARALFGVDWREHFERPLAEVRAEFGITPVVRAEFSEVAASLAA